MIAGVSRLPRPGASFAATSRLLSVQVMTFGNVLAAAAFLYGLATRDLAPRELDHYDPDYPVTVAVAATKARTA